MYCYSQYCKRKKNSVCDSEVSVREVLCAICTVSSVAAHAIKTPELPTVLLAIFAVLVFAVPVVDAALAKNTGF